VAGDAIKARLHQRSFGFASNFRSRRQYDQWREQQYAQDVADYAARRAGFLATYEQILAKAGQTWESLGLEAVVSGPRR
jgi:hypothetical protein